MDPGARYPSLPHRSSEEDYDMSRVESSSSTQHDEHLFPMSLPESGHSILTQDQDDGLSSSDISTPSETFSFSPPFSSHEPRSYDEHTTGMGTYDTTLTTPSPGSSTSTSQSKGKGRALGPSTRVSGVPQLPSLDFESEEETGGRKEAPTSKPKRVIGWNPELLAPGDIGTSLRPGTPPSFPSSSSYIDDRQAPTGSGLSRAFSQQRFELPRVMQMVVPAEASTSLSSSSFLLPSQSDTSPPPISLLFQSRATSLRGMSKNIKIKLKRSREFLRKGKHRDDLEAGISTPVLASSVASRSPSIEARSIQFLSVPDEPGVDQKLDLKPKGRSYSSPPPLSSESLSSHPLSAKFTLANQSSDTQKSLCDGEATVKDEAKDAPEKYDRFNAVLPVEIRLYIFLCLVMSFLDDLSRMVQTNSWSVATAAKMRWVGWEAGIRELVKISRVGAISFLP